MKRSFLFAAIVGTTLGVVFLGCGQLNAVVGGDCAAGYERCGNECIDVARDPNHCGRCDNVCSQGNNCVGGVCGSSDATIDVRDGNVDAPDGEDFDGSELLRDVRADRTDGSETSIDASTDDVADVSVDSCTPPYNTNDHCGDCFTKCTAPNDTCKPSGQTFACSPLCTAPLKNCFGVCVDTQTDPQNCGSCGVACISNLCAVGLCQGENRGDIVYIGHDFTGSPIDIRVAQPRVLANAVLLTQSNPIRVLAYQRYASPTAITNVTGILAATGTQSGRTINVTTTTTDADIPAMLNAATYDVLIVYDQENAPAATLGALGASWATTLTTFTKAGGIFVTLDGVAGTDPQMHEFEPATGLLSVSAHTQYPASPPVAITLTAPSDAVGKSVITPYGTRPRSARFATEPAGGNVVYVTTDMAANQPNVVHKIAPP